MARLVVNEVREVRQKMLLINKKTNRAEELLEIILDNERKYIIFRLKDEFGIYKKVYKTFKAASKDWLEVRNENNNN